MEAWAKPLGNLGATPTATRLRGGVVALALALSVAVAVVYFAVPWGYRLLLFLPFFVAANGFFQALYRT
ncbi:MAG: hypothetical protein JRI23_00285 [Deltaproteobacteria bacterium]|jgi:hypothetical protein|nr:hypothetical protein [Deltaproteobacteria bacterium]MBW2529879.1 hypothetical protein [Deltaproteobacteria bacterium]